MVAFFYKFIFFIKMEIYKELMIDFENPSTLTIPGFKKHEEVWGGCYPPNKISSLEWYKKFEDKIEIQMSKKEFFPLFRLSDGEFIFLLGRKFKQYSFFKKIYYFLHHLKRSIYYGSTFYSSGRKGYCETYSYFSLKKLRKQFINQLKDLSNEGVLCLNFSPHILTEPYQYDFVNFIKKNNITLNENNYFQFYFVPGYFMGRKIQQVYRNKRILIFTSDMKIRNENLKNNLIKFGAKKVEFYKTSLNTPLLDLIDLNKIQDQPDLIFIGAGVGSANILSQIKNLKCISIDSGFIVDALSDFNLARKDLIM